jgi:hypothetical protein
MQFCDFRIRPDRPIAARHRITMSSQITTSDQSVCVRFETDYTIGSHHDNWPTIEALSSGAYQWKHHSG